MRLNWLALERYGPFTGPVLHFRRDARLHIVYGPNEAGKSCALAAVTDLLFGIETRTRYDFLHRSKDLRIGGEIENRQGDRLAFNRRKGSKNALFSSEGEPLAEEALAPFRGGLTREVFCRAFGLNAKSLRDGAEEMLPSKGDVGATLLAAASGLRGLTELRRTLETEADGIFAPRASKDRRFYQATDRFEEARRAIRDGELKAGDWKALNTRIDELAARMGDLGARRDACAVGSLVALTRHVEAHANRHVPRLTPPRAAPSSPATGPPRTPRTAAPRPAAPAASPDRSSPPGRAG